MAEKASTLKYASVISKKSETFSLIWFKELAWTAQKAAFNSDRWWGGRRRAEITHRGQETRRNMQPTFLVCVEEIITGKKLQKTDSAIHRAAGIFSCITQKDALLRH